MNQTIVMPIGIIEEPAPAGATFRLTPQGQSAGLRTDTQVTIWRYHPEQLAMAKYAGRITQIGDETATFSILRAEVDERWPSEINPLEPGAPVYLAQRGSFEPDITLTTATAVTSGCAGAATNKDAHDPGRRRRQNGSVCRQPVLSWITKTGRNSPGMPGCRSIP